MKKVRHRMTSLFLVCPPITCIIGLMVKCAWIGTSDINNPPLPSYGWVIVILSLSLIIWFCFSKKDLFFQRAHVQSTRRSNQEKTRPPTHELQIQSRPTLLLNILVTSKIHYHRRFMKIYGFWIFLCSSKTNIFLMLKMFLWCGRETVPPLRSMTATDNDSLKRFIWRMTLFTCMILHHWLMITFYTWSF